jgi:hypothetical protein
LIKGHRQIWMKLDSANWFLKILPIWSWRNTQQVPR